MDGRKEEKRKKREREKTKLEQNYFNYLTL